MRICLSFLIILAYLGSFVAGFSHEALKSRPEVILDDFQVNDDTTGAFQSYPRIGVDGLGNFVICWEDGRNGERDIYAQRYDSNGVALGDNFRVNDDLSGASQLCPDVAMDIAGNFVITWHDRRNGRFDIYAQRYNSSGELMGENFRVDDDTVGAQQFFPSVSVDYAGNFVIGWDDYRNPNSDIYAQMYNSSGEPVGGNFRVNDDSAAWAQAACDIGLDSAGNFVITWMDWRGGRVNIYAQRYNSSGEPQGSNFQVNDGPDNAWQYDPTISVAPSGRFVIAWEDEREGYDIFAQRFDQYGTKLGVNFKVNDDTTGASQGEPSICLNDSGRFVISWQDNRNGDWDVYAQRYDQDGGLIDSNYRVANTDTGDQGSPAVVLWNNRIYDAWMDERTGKYCIWANLLKFRPPDQGVRDRESSLPHPFSLITAYPNPFNSSTVIRYSTPDRVSHRTTLRIYNILGQEVRTLIDEREGYGSRSILWDGKASSGKAVPSGIYLCQLRAGGCQAIKKLIVLR